MNSLGEYHDLYLLTDVLLLADTFEAFRKTCLKYYKIVHCYTTPGLSWQAALLMTDVKLELLDDVVMHQFIKCGVRGGVSVISHHHAVANEDHGLLYIDANNLYGNSMSQSFPVGGVKWLSDLELETFDVYKVYENDKLGYILEVDLEYSSTLHDVLMT